MTPGTDYGIVSINYLINRPAILSFACALLFVPAPQSVPATPQLGPTVHPVLPSSPSELWLVPSEKDRAARSTSTFEALSTGVKRFQEGNYPAALGLFMDRSLASTTLAEYARYYTGLTQLRLGQVAEARRTLDGVVDRKAPGFSNIRLSTLFQSCMLCNF